MNSENEIGKILVRSGIDLTSSDAIINKIIEILENEYVHIDDEFEKKQIFEAIISLMTLR